MRKAKSILYEAKDVSYAKREQFDYSNPEITDFNGTSQDVAEAYMVGFLRPNGDVQLLKYREGTIGRVVSQKDFWKMAERASKGITFGTKAEMLADCN